MEQNRNYGKCLNALRRAADRMRIRRPVLREAGSRGNIFFRPERLTGPHPYTFSVTGMEQYNR